ncbi:MAG: hypothetical protein K9L98_02250 [Candidatus Pacebacteria bacterium]|nr:hypothetical protein [Candidatus Paceibacterota bacterium]MCF7862808.1 hypothetical protein [Candidatus Paceibacterota bacterium]
MNYFSNEFSTMKKLFLIFGLSFIINWIWENAHAVLYFLPNGESISQYMLLRSTFFDAIFTLLVAFIFIKFPYFNQRKWYALVFGIVVAVLLEKIALGMGFWAYTEFMPIIPFINTGLTPTIQLGVISYTVLSFFDLKIKIFK